ncbi:MAG: protein translocase subunit SecF [Legionellales bacterium]|nr:protein translocase subunit SecF [Legionellales bacterium]|tara:strand:+ start:3243 stop:4160 length:918 start_codon:yes stop_codon:yes gene_type:complete
MEFFKQNTRIDFMRLRKWALILSIALFAFSIASLVINGLNWGLEFTGGTEVHVAFDGPANLGDIRDQLTDAGYKDVVVQSYGTTKNVLIRIGGLQDLKQKTIGDEVVKQLPGATLQSVDYIGPQVGKELATNGALALVVAMIGTAIYIALRFEYRFAISATVALIHDPIIILGVFAFFHMEFDLISLAAILTIIGYSLNDTVVVFDRVRENFRRERNMSPSDVVNMSVNQTLSRTIITSGLTFLAVLALLLFGGATLHGFAVALAIGILVGTYSSIYVAGALAVALGLNRKDLLPPTKEALDQRP